MSLRLCLGQLPARAVVSSISRPIASTSLRQLQDGVAAMRIGGPSTNASVAVEGRRFASVKSQGMYRLRDSSTIPKKLGAKKTNDSFVIPGNIIYKQRGTKWFPGENVGMGRDHTIFSLVSGYVKYYRDPKKHPDRQYIGVVFDKNDKLPYLPHAMRKRKLNMSTSPISQPTPQEETSPSGIPTSVTWYGAGKNPHPRETRIMKLREDYSYKEENWRLGTLVKTAKTGKGSRRKALRNRRARRDETLKEIRAQRGERVSRRKETDMNAWKAQIRKGLAVRQQKLAAAATQAPAVKGSKASAAREKQPVA